MVETLQYIFGSLKSFLGVVFLMGWAGVIVAVILMAYGSARANIERERQRGREVTDE